MNNTKKGFTLVELLVVIAILAILATVSVVGYTSFIDRANQSTAMQELTQVRAALIAEDINNNNFSIVTGESAAITGANAIEDFAGDLGLSGEVEVDETNKAITYTLEDKGVWAKWDLKTGTITTGKVTVNN